MSCRVSTVRERRKGQGEKASVREGKYDMKTTEMGEMLSLPGPIVMLGKKPRIWTAARQPRELSRNQHLNVLLSFQRRGVSAQLPVH